VAELPRVHGADARQPDPRAAFAGWHKADIAVAFSAAVVALMRAGVRALARTRSCRAGFRDTSAAGQNACPRPADSVPGFDWCGYRLGGGGYYDRTLAVLGDVDTGVGYACCEILDFVPGAHDRPLQRIVTDREVLGPFSANRPVRLIRPDRH
jgi:hypothetical protein